MPIFGAHMFPQTVWHHLCSTLEAAEVASVTDGKISILKTMLISRGIHSHYESLLVGDLGGITYNSHACSKHWRFQSSKRHLRLQLPQLHPLTCCSWSQDKYDMGLAAAFYSPKLNFTVASGYTDAGEGQLLRDFHKKTPGESRSH